MSVKGNQPQTSKRTVGVAVEIPVTLASFATGRIRPDET